MELFSFYNPNTKVFFDVFLNIDERMTKFYKKKIKAYSEQRVIFEKFLRQLSYGKVRVDV